MTGDEKKNYISDCLSWYKQSDLMEMVIDALDEEGFKNWGESYDELEDDEKY